VVPDNVLFEENTGTEIRADESRRKEEQGGRRLDQGDTRLQQQGGEYASRDQRRQEQTRQGDVKIEDAQNREKRLAAGAAVRQDQGWQRPTTTQVCSQMAGGAHDQVVGISEAGGKGARQAKRGLGTRRDRHLVSHVSEDHQAVDRVKTV
jgi:hypothetical protein